MNKFSKEYKSGFSKIDDSDVSEENCIDPNCDHDNRDMIRYFLYLKMPGMSTSEIFKIIVTPFDNGFYKKCDGKSSPVKWLRVTGAQKSFGFKKDIASVVHDWDYFCGENRKKSDKKYKMIRKILDKKTPWSRCLIIAEYRVLRVAGGKAWRVHERKRQSIDGYGTESYIPMMPFTPPKFIES